MKTAVILMLLVVTSFSIAVVGFDLSVDGDPTDWPTEALIETVAPFIRIGAVRTEASLYLLAEIADWNDTALVVFDVKGEPTYQVRIDPKTETASLWSDGGMEVVRLDAPIQVAIGSVVEAAIPMEDLAMVPEQVGVRLLSPEGMEIARTAKIEITDRSDLSSASASASTPPNVDAMLPFCSCSEPRDPAFELAPWINVPAGYQVEAFVPPTGISVPTDVVALPDGDVLVVSSRSGELVCIAPDGTRSVFGQARMYAIDVDSQGNIYGYNMPTGDVFLFSTSGRASVISQLDPVAAESVMAVAPDGTIYIGLNSMEDWSVLAAVVLRIPPGGGFAELWISSLALVMALDVADDGTVYAIFGSQLEVIEPQTANRKLIADLHCLVSTHGLTVAEGGACYVATTDRQAGSGSLLHVALDGTISEVATFQEGEELTGITLRTDGVVVGVQRAIGGVQAITPSGSVSALVQPNGITSPHSLAVSPCGDVVAINDESGRATVTTPTGVSRMLVEVVSYQPPQTYIAFEADGSLLAGESAPGFPSFVNRYTPDGRVVMVTDALASVSGLAVAPDGAIYASATGEGRVVRITANGTIETAGEGLPYPQALALAENGALYVTAGGSGWGETFAIPSFGDAVYVIHPSEAPRLVTALHSVTDLAFGPDSRLYASTSETISIVDPIGVSWPIFSGFQSVRGLAFDVFGRLFVADDDASAIYRISGFGTGTLRGGVFDESGDPIQAILRIQQTGPPFAGALIETDVDGTFGIPVSPGELTIVAELADGRRSVVVTITISLSEITEIAIRMPSRP